MKILKWYVGDVRPFVKHLFWRFWVCPKWSNNILLPKYGNSNSFENYTYRFWIYWVSKEEHKHLIKKNL